MVKVECVCIVAGAGMGGPVVKLQQAVLDLLLNGVYLFSATGQFTQVTLVGQ